MSDACVPHVVPIGGHVAEKTFTLLPESQLAARLGARFGFEPELHPRVRQGARIALYLFIAWLAPMMLASLHSTWARGSFLADFETHLRSLIAIPLLLLAEGQVDEEVRYVVRGLESPRRCRRPEELRARVNRLQALLEHPVISLALVAAAFLAVPAWIRQHANGHSTWAFAVDGGHSTLTAAGTWQAYVVVPVYIFLLVRWTWRWVVLAFVLARSAPLLRPVITHADLCGGFSFVSDAPARFALVIAGASSLVSARWLFQVVREGAPASAITTQMVVFPILSVILAFFPLLTFVFPFARAKRSALRRYRAVVEGHARNVEGAWFRRPFPAHVASEEASSLTDLTSIYDRARAMRVIPFRRSHVIVVLLAATLPMIPVVLALVPIERILREVFRALL